MIPLLSPSQLFAIGAAAFVFGVWQYVRKKNRLKSWIRATATVENVRRDAEGEVTVRLKFKDQAGKPVACVTPFADGDRVGLGSEVEVAYDPQSPETAFVASKGDMSLSALAWTVSGLGVMLAAAIFHFTRP
jgi:hypothetical protein